MDKKKILLHACCAPCLTYSAQKLCTDGYKPVVYFYNPNIQPFEEYNKRRDEIQRFCEQNDYELFIEESADEESFWLEEVKGMENEPEGGQRCAACFEFRLKKTAQYAKEQGFDLFTTTLTISPHKNSKVIFDIGEKIAKEHGIDFLCENFKKNDGFKKSLDLSKQYNLFRQNYCGCAFSIR